jgi:protein-S-isoprenylcysteine O-methyltransferase Ste14
MTRSDWREIVALAIFWLVYFVVHSTLASLRVKRWVARHFAGLIPGYRIAFNSLSIVLLLPLLWLLAGYHGPRLWVWQGAAAWLANGLALAAVLAFVVSLRHYDGQEFIGLRQWKSRCRQVEDAEAFHLSPFHRYVRHPWYCFSLVLIWTRDMDAASLLSGVMMTAYFIVGAHLEETKLLIYHGAAYRRYMDRVAGLFPLPWKTLSAQDAALLVKAAHDRQAPFQHG